VPDIGINLKILIDTVPALKIIATGSSSFELANTVSEPLTGRKITYQLYPIAQCELKTHYNSFELKSMLEERLIWGSYPEMFQFVGYEEKYAYMQELSADYLYKDIFILQDIRKSEKIKNLLKLLAFQIGSEVSLNELAGQLGISKETVARYIDMMEKTFVLFSLSGFNKNLRKEISKMHKYYFYDLGVRNALIDNFKPLAERNDVGALWENFLIAERIKINHYRRIHTSSYFWRTYTGAEVDYVEEGQNELAGYEFKWNAKAAKPPISWRATYAKASWNTVNRENWLEFAALV
jgi:predicted AAA+ superfamily ATPase